ncbi:MAG: hypothetical protein EOO75_11750 [Myxococcales bacterium]|nr:MAG: hypothetical protein EOO75_11750 [Myxococcales bacterium]
MTGHSCCSWALVAGLLGALGGCEPAPLSTELPAPPATRPSVACDELARTTPTARWEEAGSWPPGELLVADPATIGGPFDPPLRLEATGDASARVLVQGEGTGRRALCVQVRLGPGEAASWREGPAVVIETSMLLVGAGAPVTRALRPAEAPLVPCLEGPADDMARVTAALAGRGLTMVPVLPTLTCLEGASAPFDLTPLRAALREHRAEGRAFVEARSPAWPLLAALGDRAWAPFAPVAGAPPVALVIEAPGDGAYPVRLGRDGHDHVVLAELSLR